MSSATKPPVDLSDYEWFQTEEQRDYTPVYSPARIPKDGQRHVLALYPPRITVEVDEGGRKRKYALIKKGFMVLEEAKPRKKPR